MVHRYIFAGIVTFVTSSDLSGGCGSFSMGKGSLREGVRSLRLRVKPTDKAI